MGGYGSGARYLIQIALDHRDLHLLEWLLAHGANPNAAPARNRKSQTRSLYEEAVWLDLPEAAELLARHGATRSAPALTTDEQFIAACIRMDRDRVRQMIEANPQYLERPEVLFEAARRNRADIVAMLLDMGMSPNIGGEMGQRALHHAAGAKALDVASLLIERGADVDPLDAVYHSPPMGWAAHSDRREMLDFLSRHSREPFRLAWCGYVDRLREVIREQPELAKAIDHQGYTLLWWLPDDEDKALAIVDLALAHGVDPSARSKGRTAADWAATREMTRVEQRLRASASSR